MKNPISSDCQDQVRNSSSSTPLWVPDRNALFLRAVEDTQMLLKPNGHCSRSQGAELSKSEVCFPWQLQEYLETSSTSRVSMSSHGCAVQNNKIKVT